MTVKKTCILIALCASLAYAAPYSYAEENIDSKAPDPISFDNNLVDAVERNNIEIINAILQNKKNDINQTGKFHTSALQRAAYNQNVEVVNLLIARGADVSSVDFGGASALHIAARTGNEAIAKALLNKGADINARDEQGYTPLHRAVNVKNPQVTELLIKEGANINTVNNEGNSPLIDAVRADNLTLTKDLLTNGADKTIRNKKGKDVIDYALKTKNHDIDIELAKDYGEIIAQNENLRKDIIALRASKMKQAPATSVAMTAAGGAIVEPGHDVPKIGVAQVDVEELQAPKDKNGNPLSAVVADKNDKKWIKASGDGSAHVSQGIMPANMRITDQNSTMLTNLENNGGTLNLGNLQGSNNYIPGTPASIWYRDNASNGAVRYGMRQNNNYEADVDLVLNDYAKNIKLDKNYMNEVDAMMNQLSTDQPVAQSMPRAQIVAPMNMPQPLYQEPQRQGLYIPAEQLRRNNAIMPVMNENGEFVMPAIPVQQVQGAPMSAPQPPPRPYFAPTPMAPAYAPMPNQMNYDTYRSNLVRNVDEFYNGGSTANYGTADMQKQRMLNLQNGIKPAQSPRY